MELLESALEKYGKTPKGMKIANAKKAKAKIKYEEFSGIPTLFLCHQITNDSQIWIDLFDLFDMNTKEHK